MRNERHVLELPPYGQSWDTWPSWVDGLPASQASGIRCLSVDPGRAVLELKQSQWPTTPEGTVTHGYIDALVDNVLGVVAFTRLKAPSAPATVTLHSQHLALARLPLTFKAEAHLERDRMVRVSCVVIGADDEQCVVVTGMMSVDGTSRHGTG